MNGFLPEGYDKIPSSGRYMKLLEGKNTFRILGSAIIGWVYWNTAGKPVRLKQRPSGRPADIRTEDDGKENIKHFWAFPVWNYADKMIQILEITQSTIQTGIKTLVDDENWGKPDGYDISVNRSVVNSKVTYGVLGIPPKPLDPKIAEEYARNPVNMAALYEGGDPFAAGPSSAEAVDGPGYQEPAISVDTPTPDRLKTVPPQFRPRERRPLDELPE